MTGTAAPDVFVRYSHALDASHRVQAVQLALREAAEQRISEETTLADRYDDLDRVTGANPATWWPRITGRIRDRQAAATAAVVEQETATQRAVAAHERAIQQASEVNAAAEGLPAARMAAAEALDGASGDEAEALLTEMREIQTNVEQAARARLLAAGMSGSLASAGGMSTYDTWFGGGLLASAIKHDSIEDANDQGAALTTLLASLRPQLQALGAPTAYFSTNTQDLVGTTDVWFDNIASDLAMRDRIRESSDRASQLLRGLDQLGEQLGQRHQAIVRRLDELLAPMVSPTQT